MYLLQMGNYNLLDLKFYYTILLLFLIYIDECHLLLISSIFSSGIGMRGDIVTVSRDYARKLLFPARLVEYMSPENLMKYEKNRKVCFHVDIK